MRGTHRWNTGRDRLAATASRRPVAGLVETYGNAGLGHIEKELLRGACRVQRMLGPRHRILLACFPKSGSTWLRTILSELPGIKSAWITESTGRGEQELSAWRVARASFGHFVAQHHVRYHDDTQRLVDQFRMKPVVLVRDIFDSVVSLLDHVKHRWPEIPQAFVTPELRSLPDEQVLDFLVDMAVPWYMDFYVSWTGCADAVRLNYEELNADPVAIVSELLDRLGIAAARGEVRGAIAAADARDSLFNRAEIGRGRMLSEAQRARIVRQASYYPSVDFAPIGLSGSVIAAHSSS
ncbi:sulfotransferase domain-containing protein [Microbaculum marinum]|uniref:Sulfotransferase domain-containing protein n=1 Tax=Microbaculum marinum TaxID=1764581 RepID=A0AAW9REE7_9HYPH